jgi:hypothetical protein
METFYIIVLSIAITILIIVLAFYGIYMNSAIKTTAAYPPLPPPTCPDYWTVTGDGSCQIPRPTASSKNLGMIYGGTLTGASKLTTVNTPGVNNTNKTINFSNADWSKGGSSAICNQKAWANTLNVIWDGVSNYNGC